METSGNDADGLDHSKDKLFQPNADQKDSDGDKVGDECDLTPNGPVTRTTTPSTMTNPVLASVQDQSTDSDLDGIIDDLL